MSTTEYILRVDNPYQRHTFKVNQDGRIVDASCNTRYLGTNEAGRFYQVKAGKNKYVSIIVLPKENKPRVDITETSKGLVAKITIE